MLRMLVLQGKDAVIHKFHSVRPMAEQMQGANLPFLLSIGLRGEDCSQAYQCCQKLCGNTVLKAGGVPDEAREVATASDGAGVGSRDRVEEKQQQLIYISEAQLTNRHNICYINSFALLWAWAGGHSDFQLAAGTAANALLMLCQGDRRLDLLQLRPWMQLFEGWQDLHLQHDVCEWASFLLAKVKPNGFRGAWQSRFEAERLHIRDQGHFWQPLLVRIPSSPASGCGLRDVMVNWCHGQEARHAFLTPPQCLCICLSRFKQEAEREIKLTTVVSLRDRVVPLPVFDNKVDVEISTTPYEILGAIVHYGDTIQRGHYRAFLRSSARWLITDDDCLSRPATDSDILHLQSNWYLLWLQRC